MKVLVTGGRDYADRCHVFGELDRLHRFGGYVTLVIHGACTDPETQTLRGADRLAEEWAIAHQVPYIGVPAQWRAYGSVAGPRRNQQMLDEWKPDHVLAFPGGRGTADMVKRARKADLTLVIECPQRAPNT